ncbi:MAG TPA: glycosyltransferase family 9 protein [Lacipirellulaceae bacterium]|nr:glycosyltransferase family 9 protein [Lacipirellulaceae bacterium]
MQTSLAPRPSNADGSRRILIVRLSAIGDVIHGIPVLCALREAMPRAFIGWVAEGTAGDLLDAHPALDELVRVPRRWWKSPRVVWRLRQRLHTLRFDMAIDLQCLTKSALAARLSGAPRRIGKSGPDGRELSRLLHNELVAAGGSHVIEHYLTMLRPLGIDTPAVRFDLPERPAEARMADELLRSTALSRGAFAILNPGASWPSKLWPAERYGELARVLVVARGMPSLVVWCGESELRLAETIAQTSGGKARLAPATSMTELAALCRRAALFVGSDTGPMHLSAAVGTPTVSLHGPSRAEWCGAYGPHGASVQVRYEDGSSLQRRKADDSAMRAITVEMVAEACERVLLVPASRKCG